MLDWLENNKYLGKIIRFWVAGASCLFLLWGSKIGSQSLVDIVFFLSLILGVIEMFVLTPLINHIEKVEKAKNQSVMAGVGHRLLVFAKTFLIIILLMITYYLFGKIGQGFGFSNFTFPVEPISFGLLYMFYFEGLKNGVNFIRKKFQGGVKIESKL